ncbi:MAG TPA: hypothetical protein VGO68_08235 [Pyrinomonadaceae bacterium]|nr:hypothetical protein [Pyrinomonadaceae bacterium]
MSNNFAESKSTQNPALTHENFYSAGVFLVHVEKRGDPVAAASAMYSPASNAASKRDGVIIQRFNLSSSFRSPALCGYPLIPSRPFSELRCITGEDEVALFDGLVAREALFHI